MKRKDIVSIHNVIIFLYSIPGLVFRQFYLYFIGK